MIRRLAAVALAVAAGAAADDPGAALAAERAAQLRAAGQAAAAARIEAGIAATAELPPERRWPALAALVQLADSAARPAAAAAIRPAQPVPTPEQAAARTAAILDGAPPPALPAAPAATPAAPAVPPATVAIVSAGDDQRVDAVLLDIGERTDIKVGQRFRIVRDGRVLVTVEATRVNGGFAGCRPVAGTWSDPPANPAKGDRAVAE